MRRAFTPFAILLLFASGCAPKSGPPAMARPETIAMVGDRAHDVVGAAAHAMPCVGVTWGYAGDGELARAGAAAIIDTPTELSPILAVLARR